jgi:tetratricopeptide (TPR) repeat protein
MMSMRKPVLLSLSVLSVLLGTLYTGSVRGGPIIQGGGYQPPAASWSGPQLPSGSTGPANTPLVPVDSLELNSAMRRGLWTRACGIATTLLARQEQNTDAVEVFALCRALQNDHESARTALQRLREAEPSEYPFYNSLTQGVLHLKAASSEQADLAFKSALQARPNDPLALYFRGELFHLRDKEVDAIASFKAVLAQWPDYVPALVAAARLIASPKASNEDLRSALAMAERATAIDPTNQANWRLVVDLCERTGQQDRANAIKLQWLSRPSVNIKQLVPTAAP